MEEAAKQLGRRGGQATLKKHGKEHYREIGRKGLEKRYADKNKHPQTDPLTV